MKFSVIMPSFNRADRIFQSVESVLNQAYTDWELIIKEGGKGEGFDVIKHLLYDKRIKYFYSQDRGISEAVNIAMREARGDIFIWCNDDDLLLPNALKTITDKIGEYKWGYGKIRMMKNGVRVREMGYPVEIHQLKSGNVIPQPAVFWTRETFEKIGYMNESMQYSQDFEYWVRLMKEYPKYCFIDEILAEYTLHDGQILNKLKDKQLIEAEKVYKLI